jgi:hypothetical protein
MTVEAASAGFYESERYADRRYPRIQLLTIAGLLSGKQRLEYPTAGAATFKTARRQTKHEQHKLFERRRTKD